MEKNLLETVNLTNVNKNTLQAIQCNFNKELLAQYLAHNSTTDAQILVEH